VARKKGNFIKKSAENTKKAALLTLTSLFNDWKSYFSTLMEEKIWHSVNDRQKMLICP
tara:strand:+ start:515 stop:688 length:174 start_codon:yes stop_codon:yes gene_type:complete